MSIRKGSLKRKIYEVDSQLVNPKNKVPKMEKKLCKEEVDIVPLDSLREDNLMKSLRQGVDKIRQDKSKNLFAFQQEIDDKIREYRETIKTLNQSYFTRKDFKNLEKLYILETKDMFDFNSNYIDGNKYIPREFYYKNKAKFIQEILYGTQSELGKLVQQLHPSFKKVVEDKIQFFSCNIFSKNIEEIQEVQDLRYYSRKVNNQCRCGC